MATNATYTPAPGYPHSDGGKIEWVGRVTGINYTAGTAETIEARGVGMQYISHISGGMSASKTYFTVGSATGIASGGLQWFTSSSGAEATADLSAETSVIRVIGF